VYLHIDVNKEQGPAAEWNKLFPRKENGIPYVQVISSDGRVLHDKAGGVGLEELTKLLTQSGRILDARTAAQISKALEAAKKYLDEGKPGKAVQSILPVLAAANGAAGEIPQQAIEFAKKLVEQAKADFKDAEGKLGSTDTALEGAMAMLRISRDFAKLPGLADELKQIALKKGHKDTKEVFAQANELLAAETFASTKKSADAVKKYQAVIKKWPESAAAKLAEEKITELGGEPEKVASSSGGKAEADSDKPAKVVKKTSSSSSAGKKTVSAADKKQAEELLSLAETLADGNQDLAKDYAKQVIALAPGTDLADRAEALLKKL
jgi:tetratricopeptide (TPR) repeat protein